MSRVSPPVLSSLSVTATANEWVLKHKLRAYMSLTGVRCSKERNVPLTQDSSVTDFHWSHYPLRQKAVILERLVSLEEEKSFHSRTGSPLPQTFALAPTSLQSPLWKEKNFHPLVEGPESSHCMIWRTSGSWLLTFSFRNLIFDVYANHIYDTALSTYIYLKFLSFPILVTPKVMQEKAAYLLALSKPTTGTKGVFQR